MALMVSNDNKDLIISCQCGCENAIHFRVDKEVFDKHEEYAIMTYWNGNWYRDQDDRVLRVIGRKLKKIWAIIRNKDYYYSDILMNREDFEKFKNYINHF